jgi:hypothetical protein
MDEIHLQTRIACALDAWIPDSDSMVSNSVAQALSVDSDRAFFDLLKPLDNCSVIALEIKVQESGRFKSFNEAQRRVLNAAFGAGVPVFYCFNHDDVITNANALDCSTVSPDRITEAKLGVDHSPVALHARIEDLKNKGGAKGIGDLIACGAIAHDRHANIKGLLFFAATDKEVICLDPELLQSAFERYCGTFHIYPKALREMDTSELKTHFEAMKNTARAGIEAALVAQEDYEAEIAASKRQSPRMRL